METSSNVKHIRAELRELRQSMKERGIKRCSCFNGGHSPESYRANAKCYELESMLKMAKTGA
jgi:hypothetical protein